MQRQTRILLAAATVVGALVVASSGLAATLSPAESGVLRAVNATRTAHGLGRLRVDSTLTLAARTHSREMLRGDYFAHGDFQGRMLGFQSAAPSPARTSPGVTAPSPRRRRSSPSGSAARSTGRTSFAPASPGSASARCAAHSSARAAQPAARRTSPAARATRIPAASAGRRASRL